MRLIDADLLSEKAKGYFISPNGALRLIESQPTAFDLDEVFQKITELQLNAKDKELNVDDEEYATMLRGATKRNC